MFDALGRVRCQFCNHNMSRVGLYKPPGELRERVVAFQCENCSHVRTLAYTVVGALQNENAVGNYCR